MDEKRDEQLEIPEEIGQYLKSIRTKQRISLQKVSEKTRIKIRFLEDIESDIFENLGGTGYAKAIIVHYARAIGADEKHVLDLFNKDQKPSKEHFVKKKSMQPKKMLFSANLFAIIFLVILMIILTVVTISLYKQGKLNSPIRKKVTTKVETIEQIEKKKEQTEQIQEEIEITKQSEVQEEKINVQALRDTTDYLKEFMFQDKESPFDYQE
ncbi:MAG: helix-turn-helix domain-containing protein [Armatimonadetes bacterium]|nr:helix-turn-helix domain-containing protein [Armatimonadota bacterium]